MDYPFVFLWSLFFLNCIMIIQMDQISDVLSAEGYPNEAHVVTTADKYILTLHRIPSTKRSATPVFLNHGMGVSGYSFVVSGKEIPKSNSIAFKLADAGYDVWIFNSRSTAFAAHEEWSQTAKEYWQFSWHEIGKYDLPASIDYVLMTTNRTSMHFIGHSQGTTTVMAMLSMFPRYNSKLKTLHLMSPAIYFGHAGINLRMIALFSDALEEAARSAGIFTTGTMPEQLSVFLGHLCSNRSVQTVHICRLISELLFGYTVHFDEAHFILPNAINMFRNVHPVSLNQLLHYVQLVKAPAGTFPQFDHKEKNFAIYNQSTPLPYDLSNVKTKIHFLYGTTDAVFNYQDAELLMEQFKPWTIGVQRIADYNHVDFVLAKDVDRLVNTKILELIDKYNH